MQLCRYDNCTARGIRSLRGRCKLHKGLVIIQTQPQNQPDMQDVVRQAIAQTLNQQNVFVPQRIVPVTFELANICAPTITPQYIAGMKGLTKTQHENKECKTVDLYLGTFNILSNFNANTWGIETYGGKEVNLSLKYRGPKLINVLKEMMKECDVLVTQDNDMFFKILRELQKQNQDIAGLYFVDLHKKNEFMQLNQFIAHFTEKYHPTFDKQMEETKIKVIEDKELQEKIKGSRKANLEREEQVESLTYMETYHIFSNTLQKYYPHEYESFESFCGEYGLTYANYLNAKSNSPYISPTGIGIYFNAKKIEFVNVEITNEITEKDLKEFKIFETANGENFNCKFRKSDAVFSITNKSQETKEKENNIVVQSKHFLYKNPDAPEETIPKGINVIDNISKNVGVFRHKHQAGPCYAQEFIYVQPHLVQKIGMFVDNNQFGFQKQTANQSDLEFAAHARVPEDMDIEKKTKFENDLDLSLLTTWNDYDYDEDIARINSDRATIYRKYDVSHEGKFEPEDALEIAHLNQQMENRQKLHENANAKEVLAAMRQLLPNHFAPSVHVPQMVHLLLKNCPL